MQSWFILSRSCEVVPSPLGIFCVQIGSGLLLQLGAPSVLRDAVPVENEKKPGVRLGRSGPLPPSQPVYLAAKHTPKLAAAVESLGSSVFGLKFPSRTLLSGSVTSFDCWAIWRGGCGNSRFQVTVVWWVPLFPVRSSELRFTLLGRCTCVFRFECGSAEFVGRRSELLL